MKDSKSLRVKGLWHEDGIKNFVERLGMKGSKSFNDVVWHDKGYKRC